MPRIQLRRDTAANWTSTNPTLASGEVGVETDTGKLKIGNGSSTWTALSYFSDVELPAETNTGYVLTWDGAQWSGSGAYLYNLIDVDTIAAASPDDGDVLVWNQTNETWEPRSGYDNALVSLATLSDTGSSVDSPTHGQLIYYSGWSGAYSWETMPDAADLSGSGFLAWSPTSGANGSGAWYLAAGGGGGATTLSGLSDTGASVDSPTHGQLIYYSGWSGVYSWETMPADLSSNGFLAWSTTSGANGNGAWYLAAGGGGGATTLSGLSDTGGSVDSPTHGQLIYHSGNFGSGAKWEAMPADLSNGGFLAWSPTSGSLGAFTGGQWYLAPSGGDCSSCTLDSLSDVDASTPTNYHVLTWNSSGNAWMPMAPWGSGLSGGGASYMYELLDVDDNTQYPSSGNLLYASGNGVWYQTNLVFQPGSGALVWDDTAQQWVLDYNYSGGGGITACSDCNLPDLGDVSSAIAPSGGAVLTWNDATTVWEPMMPGTSLPTGNVLEGSLLYYNVSSGWVTTHSGYSTFSNDYTNFITAHVDDQAGSGHSIVFGDTARSALSTALFLGRIDVKYDGYSRFDVETTSGSGGGLLLRLEGLQSGAYDAWPNAANLTYGAAQVWVDNSGYLRLG